MRLWSRRGGWHSGYGAPIMVGEEGLTLFICSVGPSSYKGRSGFPFLGRRRELYPLTGPGKACEEYLMAGGHPDQFEEFY
jgi:hypothetical protein